MIFPHPVFLSQHSVEYLTRWRARHLFVLNKDNVLGDFETGDLAFAVIAHFFCRGCLSLMKH